MKKEELKQMYFSFVFTGKANKTKEIKTIEKIKMIKESFGEGFKNLEAEALIWNDKVKKMCEEATALVNQGKSQNSLEYDNLKRRANNLGYNAFSFIAPIFQNPPQVNEQQEIAIQSAYTANKGNDREEVSRSQSVKVKYKFSSPDYQYRWVSLWEDGSDKTRRLNEIVSSLEQKNKNIDAFYAKHDEWIEMAKAIYEKVNSDNYKDYENEIQELGKPLTIMVNKKIENASNRLQKLNVRNNYSTIVFHTDGYGNEISRLKACKSWTLLIDETGYKNYDSAFDTNGSGMIAGVLFDNSNPLPDQPPHHGTDEKTAEDFTAGDEIINTILMHENCGVLVMPVKNYSSAHGWINMLASFINLVIDMLPLGNDKTSLSVIIENKGIYKKTANFNMLTDFCRSRLQVYTPERAKKITLNDIKVMTKDYSLNAYPDMVAYTGLAKNPLTRERLDRTGWKRSGVLPKIEPEKYQHILENFYTSTAKTSAYDWNEIVLAQLNCKNTLIDNISKTIGFEAQNNPSLWRTYLNYTVNHLDSKAIDMYMLAHQIDWLKQYEPVSEMMSGKIKLLWLVTKLAEENHRGNVPVLNEAMDEYRRLSAELFVEDAPLCCWADLHLAVTYTNAFEFDKAGEVIASWEKCPAAMPGLQYYGQLLSTMGQHRAFVGKNSEAIKYFNEAISTFNRLSDKEQAAKDENQTLSYLVISMMDSGTVAEEMEAMMCRYFNESDIASAITRLAQSKEPSEKYMHHILLRYLTSLPIEHQYCQQYLSLANNWSHQKDGHPWELIEFYRGLLQHANGNIELAKQSFEVAHEIAIDGGPTLKIIDAVIIGTYAAIENISFDEYVKLVEEVIEAIPAIGEARKQVLRSQPKQKIKTIEFVKAVLPFNFR